MTKQNKQTIDSLLTEIHDISLELEETKDDLERVADDAVRSRKINDFLLKVAEHFFDFSMQVVRSKIDEDIENDE